MVNDYCETYSIVYIKDNKNIDKIGYNKDIDSIIIWYKDGSKRIENGYAFNNVDDIIKMFE